MNIFIFFLSLDPSQKYTGIGLMSGTSLDGLDIAFCEFVFDDMVRDYRILEADTFRFPEDLAEKLERGILLQGTDLVFLNNTLGTWIGNQCVSFMKSYNIKPDFIASHGHTIFHQPEHNMTFQVGNGNIIHAITRIPVVYNFRELDVALGGQGAPLVPIGDRLLFSEFEICMNLGGFANISFEENNLRRAYDIGACNIVLNKLASVLGHKFDPEGSIARSGTLIKELLEELDKLSYYSQSWPKSLGKEWVEKKVMTLIDGFRDKRVEDILHTYTHHIATIIANDLNHLKKSSFLDSSCQVLVTGGGAYNQFLIETANNNLDPGIEFKIPDDTLIAFKEALVFSLMGFLRIKDITNCLASVTGASRDSCCGVIAGSINQLTPGTS